MTNGLLITTIILLSEVIVVLLVLLYFLNKRLSKQKEKLLEDENKITQLVAQNKLLMNYKKQFDQASRQLDVANKSITDLENQLKDNANLEEQSHLIQQLKKDNSVLKDRLDQTLEHNAILMQADNSSDKQSHDKELSMYMDLVSQANEKLKKSNETIARFKTIINNSTPSEEIAQLESMVGILSEDNLILQEQLDSLKQPLNDSQDKEQSDQDLSLYKNLVEQANNKLIESNKTIEDLKKSVYQHSDKAELEQMESMVDELSNDNAELRSNIVNINESSKHKIQAIEKESQRQQEALRDELNMYKDLVNQANDKLKESNSTIEELRNIVNNDESTEQTIQMKDMLNKLSDENMSLSQQLESVNNQLQVTLDSIEEISKRDIEITKELAILKDQNWFLEEQIKHYQQKETDSNDMR